MSNLANACPSEPPLRAKLKQDSFVHLRAVLDAPTQMLFAMLQNQVDQVIERAIAGETTWIGEHWRVGAVDTVKIGNFMSSVSGLPDDGLYWRVFETVTKALLPKFVTPEEKLARTPYAGLFVSDPRLSMARNFYFHSDGHFDGLDNAGVNFWIPLRDCGRDAPGLTLIAADEQSLVASNATLPTKPEAAVNRHSAVDWPSVTVKDIERAFGRQSVQTPEIKLGDVIVFTSRHVHRTHCTDAMSHGRAAAIVRYNLVGQPFL